MCIEEASQLFILGLWHSSLSCYIMHFSMQDSFLSHNILNLGNFIFFSCKWMGLKNTNAWSQTGPTLQT